MVRMVVKFADIPCEDALEMFNYDAGLVGIHLMTVCGPKRTNDVTDDSTAIYTDSDGAYVTYRTFPGEKTGRGFLLSYTAVDPEERMCEPVQLVHRCRPRRTYV